MTAPVLLISGLVKSYPFGFLHRHRRRVLGPLDLHVQSGEIFGYLGPNGAGKTTTIKALMGFVSRDAGRIEVLGHDWKDPRWRARVGFLPEQPYFYDYLSPTEYLDYAGALIGLSRSERRSRAAQLLEQLGLADAASRSLRRFSKGMLQRLGLAQALIGEPDLLILDEPMSGLDPLGRRLVRNLILEQKERGRAVLFSTHILSDAESLCDRVALLRDGRVVGQGRLDEILQIGVGRLEVLVSGLPDAAAAELTTRADAHGRHGERLRLEVEEAALVPLLQSVQTAGGRVLSVQPVRQSLEDLFVSKVGGAAPGGEPA